MKSKEVIEAQLEILRGYYTKIGFQSIGENTITVEDIMGMLESDMEFMEGEIAIYAAEQIINADNKK